MSNSTKSSNSSNPLNNYKFYIHSLSELILQIEKASKSEFSTIKPGNIGPTQSIKGINFQDYSNVNSAICGFSKNYFQDIQDGISLGDYILKAVKTMMDTVPNQNLQLGHILLYTPLIFVSIDLIKLSSDSSKRNWNEFWELVEEKISKTTTTDAIFLSKAILISKAGGLYKPGGNILKSVYDLQDPLIEKKILEDKKTLLDLFKESDNWDSISKQYSTNYRFCRSLIQNWVLPNHQKFSSSSEFILELFIYILSKIPDSLIFRKNNKEIAENVQKKAIKILKYGGVTSKIGKKLIFELNDTLMCSKGELNPGTTADLTACILFICQIFKIYPTDNN